MTELTITAISDTHSLHDKIDRSLFPGGDLLVHCGDFTGRSTLVEIGKFAKWLSQFKQDYDEVILVAGNHDLGLENVHSKTWCTSVLDMEGITYLENKYLLYKGYVVFGSPVQPQFLNWAFNWDENHRKQLWSGVGEVDILLTHAPPKNHLDTCNANHLGCPILENYVNKTKPLAHIFGHIHEGYGLETTKDTLFVNASICTGNYTPSNKPITVKIGGGLLTNS